MTGVIRSFVSAFITQRHRNVPTQYAAVQVFFCLMLITFGSRSGLAQARATVAPAPAAMSNTQAAQHEALKKEVAALKRELKELTSRVIQAESDIRVLQILKSDARRSTQLSTDSKGYGRVDTEAGSFLLVVEDLTPYLDGFKVKLKIGNINTAAYTDFVLKLFWYPTNANVLSSKSKEESMTQCLKPGTWNDVEVILPNTKPGEVGKIDVEIETKTVSFACR